MIYKNEIPILEYDDSSAEVLAPDHGLDGLRLPEKCLFAFLGDVVHNYADSHEAEVAQELVTVSHIIKVYVLHEAGSHILHTCLIRIFQMTSFNCIILIEGGALWISVTGNG